MKLEIKHLTPYLPYGLKAINHEDSIMYELCSIGTDKIGAEHIHFPLEIFHPHLGHEDIALEAFWPIMRPLSDLTKYKPSSLQGMTFFQWAHYNSLDTLISDVLNGRVKQLIFTELLENHFDVFSLIEKDLAIDINTI